jgi:hypothetical protein
MQNIVFDTAYIEWGKIKKRLINYYSSLEPKHTIASSLGIQLKYSGYFAMIPENFDIDAHLAQYPLTDYMFVKDNTGRTKSVPKTRNLDSSLLFDKDRLIYIIGLISSIPAKNKDSITEDGYVVINSLLIRNAFKDYWSYLDYLIQTDVLCTDGQYIVGEKSKGYKFTERYNNVPLKRYDYPVSQAGVDAIPHEVFSEEDKTFLINTVIDFPHLSYWYSVKKLSIDEVAASHYAYSVMQDKIRNGKKSWDINRDKSHRNAIIRKDPKTQYHAAQHNIHSIAVGDYKVSIDTNVHRLHSVITNLQKKYRNFLTFNGQELVNIDISNSQPYLASILLNPAFWAEKEDCSMTLNFHDLDDNIKELFPEILISEAKLEVSNPENFIEYEMYKRLVSSGNFYEEIVKLLDDNINRDTAKTMTFAMFFSSNRGNKPETLELKRKFRHMFPHIYELFKTIKRNLIDIEASKQYRRLACMMQNIESKLILHKCCKRIWEEQNHQIPIFTIHDSIVTTVGNELYVKRIMEEMLFNSLNLIPTLKLEYWQPNTEY